MGAENPAQQGSALGIARMDANKTVLNIAESSNLNLYYCWFSSVLNLPIERFSLASLEVGNG
jgi:hypothetical protein